MGKNMRNEIVHEVAVLERASAHAHIVDLFEVFETSQEMIIVLELVPGGELYKFCNDNLLTEPHMIRVMRQVLQAVDYLHGMHIVHLDLKPSNILLTDERAELTNVKLCDFGISRRISAGIEVRDIVGTPDYVAPEVLNYDPIGIAADIWSVGVLAYVLATGHSPFAGDTKLETINNISQHLEIDFPDELFDDFEDATPIIDFIQQLLIKDPKQRPTASTCLQHAWLQTPTPALNISAQTLLFNIDSTNTIESTVAVVTVDEKCVALRAESVNTTGQRSPSTGSSSLINNSLLTNNFHIDDEAVEQQRLEANMLLNAQQKARMAAAATPVAAVLVEKNVSRIFRKSAVDDEQTKKPVVCCSDSPVLPTPNLFVPSSTKKNHQTMSITSFPATPTKPVVTKAIKMAAAAETSNNNTNKNAGKFEVKNNKRSKSTTITPSVKTNLFNSKTPADEKVVSLPESVNTIGNRRSYVAAIAFQSVMPDNTDDDAKKTSTASERLELIKTNRRKSCLSLSSPAAAANNILGSCVTTQSMPSSPLRTSLQLSPTTSRVALNNNVDSNKHNTAAKVSATVRKDKKKISPAAVDSSNVKEEATTATDQHHHQHDSDYSSKSSYTSSSSSPPCNSRADSPTSPPDVTKTTAITTTSSSTDDNTNNKIVTTTTTADSSFSDDNSSGIKISSPTTATHHPPGLLSFREHSATTTTAVAAVKRAAMKNKATTSVASSTLPPRRQSISSENNNNIAFQKVVSPVKSPPRRSVPEITPPLPPPVLPSISLPTSETTTTLSLCQCIVGSVSSQFGPCLHVRAASAALHHSSQQPTNNHITTNSQINSISGDLRRSWTESLSPVALPTSTTSVEDDKKPAPGTAHFLAQQWMSAIASARQQQQTSSLLTVGGARLRTSSAAPVDLNSRTQQLQQHRRSLLYCPNDQQQEQQQQQRSQSGLCESTTTKNNNKSSTLPANLALRASALASLSQQMRRMSTTTSQQKQHVTTNKGAPGDDCCCCCCCGAPEVCSSSDNNVVATSDTPPPTHLVHHHHHRLLSSSGASSVVNGDSSKRNSGEFFSSSCASSSSNNNNNSNSSAALAILHSRQHSHGNESNSSSGLGLTVAPPTARSSLLLLDNNDKTLVGDDENGACNDDKTSPQATTMLCRRCLKKLRKMSNCSLTSSASSAATASSSSASSSNTSDLDLVEMRVGAITSRHGSNATSQLVMKRCRHFEAAAAAAAAGAHAETLRTRRDAANDAVVLDNT